MITQPHSRPTYIRIRVSAALHSKNDPITIEVTTRPPAPADGRIEVTIRPFRGLPVKQLTLPREGGSTQVTLGAAGRFTVSARLLVPSGSAWQESHASANVLLV